MAGSKQNRTEPSQGATGVNEDIEELLRDGMERFTKEVRAPAGLARTVGQLHRRRMAVRAAAASGAAIAAAAVAVALVTGVGGAPGPAGPPGPQARTAAYVVSRVENALAGTNLVFRGRTASTGQTSVTWAYGPQSRFEEYWPTTDYRDRVVNGQRLWDFPPNLRGQPYLTQGTALIGGKLTNAYITYYNHEYSLSPLSGTPPGSACSTNAALSMGAPPVTGNHWSAFIRATLACGAARVTGHVRIRGMETTKITGVPVKVKLSPGYAKAVREKWARAQWTLYVNPKTYLPVRIYGSTQTFGGPAPSTRFTSVTDVQWLPPTAANIAKTLVTIPPGFHRVNVSAQQ
jgi:hypothetical protein